MSNYVKKYNTGNIMIDLPYNSHIHELPLLSFSDFRNSVNISLVFNKKLCSDNNNMFNITSGYKLNIQKRIVMDSNNVPTKFIDSNGKQVLLIKNYNTLDHSSPFNGVYTFDDESKRVLRSISNGYEIEYEDLSKEQYNISGYIMQSIDKYGDIYLSYEYNNELLQRIIYNGKTVHLNYSNNKLISLSYGNVIIEFTFMDGSATIYHYSGVTYYITYNDTQYIVRANGVENSTGVNYYNECTYSGASIVLKRKIGTAVIDNVTYTFPYLSASSYYRYGQVEITNRKGVTHRVQFNGDIPLCSYEIDSDAEFDNVKYKGDVQIFDQLYKVDNKKNNCCLSYNDGIGLMLENASTNKWYTSVFNGKQTKGYYLLTGWIKLNDDSLQNDQCMINVSNNSSVSDLNFYVNFEKPRQWHFFACKFYFDANYIYVTPSCDSAIELKDLRILYQKTHEVDQNKKERNIISENILVYNTSNSTRVIPFSDVEFEYTTESNYTGIINVSLSDLIRYIKRAKVNENTNFSNEIYYNDGKNVINDVLSFKVIEKELNVKNNLSNYDIGNRYYKDGKKHENRIEKYNSQDIPFCITHYKEGSSCSYEYVNKYFETIQKVEDNVSIYYTRDKGLITNERIGNLSNITYNYGTTTLEVKDTYNNNYLSDGVLYYMDSIWGNIYKIEYSDGTIVEDTFDDDKTTLLKKTFKKNTDIIENHFSYEKGFLSSLTTDILNYEFDYLFGKLSTISKFGSVIETQTHSDLNDTFNYIDGQYTVYSKEYNYDKYGRLINITDELDNVYNDSANSMLNYSIDRKVNTKENYYYNDENLLIIKSISNASNLSEQLGRETFSYDTINRLIQKAYVYNSTTGNSVADEITYMKGVNDLNVDDTIASTKYYIDEELVVTSSSEYDGYKRLKEKSYVFKKGDFTKTYGKEYFYDRNRISQERTKLSNITSNVITYSYDNFDRISSILNINKLLSYQYDSFGRLIRENNEALDKTIIYEYNDIGNIISKKVYDYTTSTPSTLLSTLTYNYDSTQKDRLIAYNNISIPYNALGCPIKYNGYDLIWSKGKLIGLSKGTIQSGTESYTYTYNAYGQRVSKQYLKTAGTDGIIQIQPDEVTNRYTKYNYDHLGRLINEIISNTYYNGLTTNEKVEYIYDVNTIIGMKHTSGSNSNTYYFERNILGDVIGIYDLNTSLKVRYLYDAYGNCTISTETTDQVLANLNPIRYRGYYYDVETGLFYCNSRYYNSEWCRWISPDDIEYLDPESVNGLNLYCYCKNNPIMYVDPSGHIPVDTIIDIGFAFWSFIDLIRNPSRENAVWFVLDLACLIIPYATGGSTAVKGIVKGVNGADNLLDASKVPGYIMRNADDVVLLGQNMDRVYDASRKIGGGIIYGGLDDFASIKLKYGDEIAEALGYADNMKWIRKQAWSGKTVLNIGVDLSRLDDPIKYANSFKVCKGELFWYRAVMLGKFAAFWSHRIYRMIFGGF